MKMRSSDTFSRHALRDVSLLSQVFPRLLSATFTCFEIARGITLVLLFRHSVKNRNCLVREHRGSNLPFNNYHKDQLTSIQLQRYGKLFWLIRSVKWLWHEYLKLQQQRVFPDYRWLMFSILFLATKEWCSADRFFFSTIVVFPFSRVNSAFREIKIWFGSERKHYPENSFTMRWKHSEVKSAKSAKLAITKFTRINLKPNSNAQKLQVGNISGISKSSWSRKCRKLISTISRDFLSPRKGMNEPKISSRQSLTRRAKLWMLTWKISWRSQRFMALSLTRTTKFSKTASDVQRPILGDSKLEELSVVCEDLHHLIRGHHRRFR